MAYAEDEKKHRYNALQQATFTHERGERHADTIARAEAFYRFLTGDKAPTKRNARKRKMRR